MDTLKNLANKLTGQSAYHHNLLGESLPDLLRKATAKTLVTPDESINQQVVDTIQQEAASGKDTKDIVNLLKKRLRTDNPQKQWLGVMLFTKVLPDCSNVLGMHQEELLQEVAKVMTKPARPETEAGKAARHAAKELLRRYGRAGTSAWRAAHQEVYGRPGGGMAAGVPVGAIPYGYTAADYGNPAMAAAAIDGGVSVERQSLAEEINLLIDKARSNTELLSDMLVNHAPGTAASDEFEQELIHDLLKEVVELRGLFDAYLEQLQAHEGADMEVLMVQALEAVDLLDGVIALQKDVSSNQELPSTASGGTVSAATAAAVAGVTAAANTGGSTVKKSDDLIALDDLADGLMGATISSPANDPFAASTTYGQPARAAPAQPAPAAAGPAAAGQPGMKSAFENMFAQPGGVNSYSALSAAAPPAGSPATAPAPAPVPQSQPQPHAGYYAPNPYPGAYGAAPPASSPYGTPPTGGQYPQQQQAYGGPQYGAFGAPPQHQYAQPPAMHQYSSAPQAQPFGGMPTTSSNPFGAGVPPQRSAGAPPASNPNNPFANSVPAPGAAPVGGSTSLDQEWNLFFADRTSNPQQSANAQRV